MWWETLLISLIPSLVSAVISGLISYKSASKKAEADLTKTNIEYKKEIESIREKSISERDRLTLEFELKLQEMDKEFIIAKENRKEDLTYKLLQGIASKELDVKNLLKNAEEIQQFTSNSKK